MSERTDEDLARACFENFYVLGRNWLDMADETQPSGNFEAMLRGDREPSDIANTCRDVITKITHAIGEARREGGRTTRDENLIAYLKGLYRGYRLRAEDAERRVQTLATALREYAVCRHSMTPCGCTGDAQRALGRRVDETNEDSFCAGPEDLSRCLFGLEAQEHGKQWWACVNCDGGFTRRV